jgi:hypothetical protein
MLQHFTPIPMMARRSAHISARSSPQTRFANSYPKAEKRELSKYKGTGSKWLRATYSLSKRDSAIDALRNDAHDLQEVAHQPTQVERGPHDDQVQFRTSLERAIALEYNDFNRTKRAFLRAREAPRTLTTFDNAAHFNPHHLPTQ